MNNVAIYSFSFNNPERVRRMNHRFESVGYPVNWVAPVLKDDPRIAHDSPERRTHAIMYNHIDMLKQFLGSSAEFGIFCEDDIYIRRDFDALLSQAIASYKRLELDVMLLGYLMPYNPCTHVPHPAHKLLELPLLVMSYDDGLWGSQMYICDKAGARKLITAFSDPTKTTLPFSPDWTITKFGKRALVHPMLAVEEGNVVTDHLGQQSFHKQCTATHYDPSIHF